MSRLKSHLPPPRGRLVLCDLRHDDVINAMTSFALTTACYQVTGNTNLYFVRTFTGRTDSSQIQITEGRLLRIITTTSTMEALIKAHAKFEDYFESYMATLDVRKLLQPVFPWTRECRCCWRSFHVKDKTIHTVNVADLYQKGLIKGDFVGYPCSTIPQGVKSEMRLLRVDYNRRKVGIHV